MSSYNKLAKNSVVFAIGNFGSKFIALLMLPFYTHQLTQSEYGQVELIIVTISLLIPVLTVNIVEAVIRFALDKKNYSYGEVITNSLLFVVLGFTLLLALYPLFSNISFISEYATLFYGVFLIQALNIFVKQFARSIDLIKVYMISDMFYTISFVIFNILFIYYFQMGVQGYFLSMILAYSLDLIFLSKKTAVTKYIKIIYLDKTKIKSMFIYCIPLIPNAIMWWVMSISDRYILAYFLGLSATGVYAIATKFPLIISNMYAVFYKAWQISAIEEYESSNKDEFYTKVFGFFFFIMTILASTYILFNKLIVSLLVAPEFYTAWKYTPILVLAVVFSSFSSFIGTNYVAMKKTKGALLTSLVGAIANFLLNIILIPHYGIYGACISTLISFIIVWMLRVIDTRKFVIIKYPKLKMLLVFLLIGIQLIIEYLNMGFVFSTVIGALIIFLIILLSLDYTKKPTVMIYNKLIGRFSK